MQGVGQGEYLKKWRQENYFRIGQSSQSIRFRREREREREHCIFLGPSALLGHKAAQVVMNMPFCAFWGLVGFSQQFHVRLQGASRDTRRLF